jgi:TPR repeat protein
MAKYAQWRLAMMHLQGVGTPKDSGTAYRILERASENGGINAMISRAVMLATGQGVAEDDAAARDWYRRAAESGEVGFAHGLRALGAMLVVGEGGPVDLPRGIAYLRIAKAAGDDMAGRLLDTWSGRVTDEVHRKAVEISNAWMARHMPAD